MPVALNLYKIREQKDEAGDFFRSAQKQKDQYQGLWIVSPDGKVLAAHHDVKDQKNWASEVLDVLDAGQKAFGSVTPRTVQAVNPLPYRGAGVRPDGSVTLALYTRHVFSGKAEGWPVHDSITLDKKDTATLTPAKAAKGEEWQLTETVARQFCRCLSPTSDQSTMPRPEEVTEVRILGRVEEIKDGVATLTYRGKIAAAHLYLGKTSYGDGKVNGVGRYDVKRGELQSLTWVVDSIHRPAPPYDEPRTIAAVVEWKR